MPQQKKTIAIVGGGFGGLRAALDIAKQLKKCRLANKYEVVLVDRRKHHVFTPLLYEAATAPKEQTSIQELHRLTVHSFSKLLPISVRLMHRTAVRIDTEKKKVHFAEGEALSWEYIIIAPGSEPNYFDIPGLQENALSFNSFVDAIAIREHIWMLAEKGKVINVVIGGGGPTGVELAGELALWCRGLKEERNCKVKITLIDANKRILSPFHKKVSTRATKRLKKLGVHIMTNKRVRKLTKDNVHIEDEQIPYSVFVWAGGVKASGLLQNISAKKENRGKIQTTPSMQCLPRDPHLHPRKGIYIIGDSVCVINPKTASQVPAMARPAIEQGEIAAYNVVADVLRVEHGKAPKHKKYRPYNYPYIVPVGGKYAIATVGPFVFSGFFAWVFKGLVELNYFRSILPIHKAFALWLKGLWVFTRNERLG